MNIKIGSRVRVRQWGGGVVEGVVTDILDDVKNGRPGIDYATDSTYQFERNKWCYLDQVLSVTNN